MVDHGIPWSFDHHFHLGDIKNPFKRSFDPFERSFDNKKCYTCDHFISNLSNSPKAHME